ncbi:MAG: hypothetical protein OSA84_02940 [Akkermansiaceae bacterium]|nr:hypothetical protein [Akkermansiaceae bacterium]
MPRIPSIFEQELRNASPAVPDEAFLARLTACAEGRHTELSEEEMKFGELLRATKPRDIPAAMKNSLLAAIGDAPFAIDEKIVLFNRSAAPSPGRAKTRWFNHRNIAAAAAVALFGGGAALLIPGTDDGNKQTAAGYPGSGGGAFESHFAPASYGRNLSETKDEGVIWRGKNQPHRVLRLKYIDKVTMKNDKGETFEVERPRFEYVIIPEKVD